MGSETIFTQKYPAHGYEVRTEMITQRKGTDPVRTRRAYTAAGDYIGDHRTAEFLCEKMGIAPEKITPKSKICSIGFCEKEQNWYGWVLKAPSPMLLGGFGIGSKVERGDPGYAPDTVGELADLHDGMFEEVEIVDGRTIRVTVEQYAIIGENEDGTTQYADEPDTSESYTVKTGRGEWTAKTLEDARQMAIDFAENASFS